MVQAMSPLNILVVASYYPMHDRASGDLRFHQFLSILAASHTVHFCSIGKKWQVEHVGASETDRYRHELEANGVKVLSGGVANALKAQRYDAVLFEFYYVAEPWIEAVRIRQPHAKVIVDSVDVAYHRLLAKARVTQSEADMANALKVKADELSVYKQADVVITVTEEDSRILREQDAGMTTVTIPNIHAIPELARASTQRERTLVFVGSFIHEPNVDAMLYFCREIFPQIAQAVPDVQLKIIGNAPPEEIKALASERVEVLGYVPETAPYLETSYISVAPLRFGAGMKGKIGEAMSHALPVVTTAAGIEGFGLTPDQDVLVGDTPEAFANAVIRLLMDQTLYERIRMAGYEFIRSNYSEEAVAARIGALFSGLDAYPTKRIGISNRIRKKAGDLVARHLSWRFK